MTTLPDGIAARIQVEPTTGCWLWVGTIGTGGYGQCFYRHWIQASHRVVYQLLVGPIPRGMQLDHVKARGCSTPACCNPEHLEPVTPRENTLRSNAISAEQARRTHCARGHKLGGDNTYSWRGDRRCRQCNIERCREWKVRKRGMEASP